MDAPLKKGKRWTRAAVSRLMVRRARKRKRAPASGLEKEVQGWLEAAGIPYRKQYPIGLCHADMLLGLDLVLEIQGCYWHGHARCQKQITTDQRTRQRKDRSRFKYFLRCGYKLMLLWECDIHKDGQDVTVDRIRRRLKKEYGF